MPHISLCGLDYIISPKRVRRIVSEDFPYFIKGNLGIFPADFLYLVFFKPLSLSFQITVWAYKFYETFQHMVEFYNRPTLNVLLGERVASPRL